MAETIVERMARAMCEADGLDWSKQSDQLQNGSGADDRAYYLGHAIASLKALRCPTESMCVSGGIELQCEYDTQFGVDATAKEIWQAMIDQAIKEGGDLS